MADLASQALERRRCIKEIMEAEGFNSINDLKNKLAKQYGIRARFETLEKDIRNLGQVDEAEIQPVLDKVIGNCERYLKMIQDMVDNPDASESHKLKAIKLYFTAGKSITHMLKLMTQREEVNKIERKKDDEPPEVVSIMFGDE